MVQAIGEVEFGQQVCMDAPRLLHYIITCISLLDTCCGGLALKQQGVLYIYLLQFLYANPMLA